METNIVIEKENKFICNRDGVKHERSEMLGACPLSFISDPKA